MVKNIISYLVFPFFYLFVYLEIFNFMEGVHIIENYNYIIIPFLCNFKSLINNEYYSFKKIKEKGKNEKIYTPKLSSLQVKKYILN